MMRSKCTALLVIALFLVAQYGAAGGKAEDKTEFSDPRNSWTLLLTETVDNTTEKTAETVCKSLDILVEQELLLLPAHQYTDHEISNYQDYLYQTNMQTMKKQLAEQTVRRDSAFIRGDLKDYEKIREEILNLEKKIRSGVAPSIQEEKSIAYKKEKLQILNPSQLEQKGVDAVLNLTLDQSGFGYLVTATLLVPFRFDGEKKMTHFFKGEQIEEAAKLIVDFFKADLLGRSWATLEASTIPSGAAIEQQGLPLNKDALKVLSPGSHSFRVTYPGYHGQNIQSQVYDNQRERLQVELRARKPNSVELETTPPGAMLYLDGRFEGYTPLQLETGSLPSVIGIEAEGFRSVSKPLTRDNWVLSFQLEPDLYDPSVLVDMKRKRFYNSFGAFLLSIPITMFSYGISTEYAITAANANDAYLEDRNRFWYTIYQGGLAVNFLLGINMLRDLLSYIETYESRVEKY